MNDYQRAILKRIGINEFDIFGQKTPAEILNELLQADWKDYNTGKGPVTYQEYKEQYLKAGGPPLKEPEGGFEDWQIDCILYKQLDMKQAIKKENPQEAQERKEKTFLKDLVKLVQPDREHPDGVKYPTANEAGAAFLEIADFAHIIEYRQLCRKEGGIYRKDADVWIRQKITEQLPIKPASYRNECVNFVTDNTSTALEQFDKDKNIINCKNGFLNMDTLQLMPHNTDYKSLIQIDTEYNPDLGTGGKFLDVLKQACPEYYKVILQVTACALTRGQLNPELCLIFYGDGNNGKSSVLLTLGALFGAGNVSHISMQYVQNNDFAAFGLLNKMLNIYHDLPNREMTAMDKLLPLISQEPINIEQKKHDSFPAWIYAIMLYSTNELPALNNYGTANMKRVNVIPFKRRFEKNDKIKNEIQSGPELSKLLNLLMEYRKAIKQRMESEQPLIQGRQPRETTRDIWQHASDAKTAFIADYIRPLTKDDKPKDMPTFREVYTTCIQWAYANNRPVPSDKELTKALNMANFATFTTRENYETVVKVRGILKEWQEPEPPESGQATID